MFNKKIGDKYESEFLELLKRNGWWCHLFAYKAEGQPCDVIALKNDTPILIDVKHCNAPRFYFGHIRPNQKSCFALAYEKHNNNCGFAVYFDKIKEWRWLPYSEVLFRENKGIKSISSDECYTLRDYGIIDFE